MCQLIKWPLVDDQVLPLFKNRSGDKIECKDKDNKYKISIMRINSTKIIVVNPLNKEVDCYSQSITRRNKSDKKIEYGQSLIFDHKCVKHFPNDIAVKIECKVAGDSKSYSKVIPLIPELKSKPREGLNELPNILFVGIDSISRLNFDRQLSQTSQLLSNHSFYTFYGYNKVGDNTFPNLTPLLTGLYVKDLWNETILEPFDYFPIIWKEYKERGYLTFYMEDAPVMNTFNYEKVGFADPPTDYYLRPFFLAMDKYTDDYCYLDKPEVEVYYEYLIDFLRAMNERQQKFFAFHFMARLTHDVFNNAGLYDNVLTDFFTKVFDENLLTNTILVFFSDHGLRFGPIRETLSGKYEERLPFMQIYVPNKWHNNNLTLNQNRLTTPFDIHATLKHIIEGKANHSLKYGKSLFEEIPKERSCKSIPISDHWCGCQTSKPINDLKSVQQLSEFIVKNLNEIVSKDFSEECIDLILNKTVSAFEQQLNDKVMRYIKSMNDVVNRPVVFSDKSIESEVKNYLITIRVNPSNALFEATVNLNKTDNKMLLIGDISRINLYSDESHCIKDPFLKKYCYCRDLL